MDLPARGLSADEVRAQLLAAREGDGSWREGRLFSLVYSAGEDVHAVAEEAARLYLFENALNTQVFPSLGRLQHDILGIVAGLLHGGDTAAGFMTSGGTESILMAVKVARDWGRKELGVTEPEMVLASSAHAAFAKASHYFGVRSVRVDVGADWRADVDAMAGAINDNTVLVVGSAPTYPQGVVDDIPALAALARDRGILCHVDACMGGLILPFLERLGHFAQAWDFRVDGVTSISADLHKYGYAPKGASTVTYRTRELRRYQAFTFDGWLGGFYGSPGMQGTRGSAPIAAAWAVLNYLGEEGYLRLASASWDAARTMIAGIRSIDGLMVRGEPDATVFSFGAAEPEALDIFAVGEALSARGWYLDRQTPPDSLHATVSAANAPVVEEFLADLRACLAEVSGRAAADRATTYGTVE